jgi:ABC-type Fe3+/spermidine/putrescine transport system ATPase subunit
MDRAKGIRLEGIAKSYGRQKVLHHVDLDVAAGEFVSMLGPSGSGKTTILKIIAGFEAQDSGHVRIGGRDMTGIAPEHRNIGVVFQNYSLFPHMDVAANIGFPLRMRKVARAEQRERIERALALVALEGFGSRLPGQLSGGQQQRVAIARAIVFEPDILLMDEPLGALDRRLRGDMQLEIKALHERLGITIVYITHDQEEALSMSDRVVVFNRGRVEQIGTPREVYRTPATSFVADFLGDSLTVSAEPGPRSMRLRQVALDMPSLAGADGNARLLWRSDEVEIGARAGEAAINGSMLTLPAKVLTAAYAGTALRLRILLVTGDTGIVLAPDAAQVRTGDEISIRLDLAKASVLPADDGQPNGGGSI